MDAFADFCESTLALGVAAGATSLTVAAGDGNARFTQSAPYWATIWDTSHPGASKDPNREQVRVIARVGDVLTINPCSLNHNTGGKTYGIVATLTAKTLNDINEASITKTQAAVAATDMASITVSGPIDHASGVIELHVGSDDGTESATVTLRRFYSIAKGASGVAGGISNNASGQPNGPVLVVSNGGVFNPGALALTTAISGSVVTFTVTTVDALGAQTHATIEMTIRDFTGHTITPL